MGLGVLGKLRACKARQAGKSKGKMISRNTVTKEALKRIQGNVKEIIKTLDLSGFSTSLSTFTLGQLDTAKLVRLNLLFDNLSHDITELQQVSGYDLQISEILSSTK